ncbi:MAG: YfiR family protein [Candidatus Aminicenantes bacterium]|nr:YfiR family protein [Candidatus Aminicenantes bacterium]
MKRKKLIILFLLIILTAQVPSFTAPTKEYAIKAAILAKLLDNITWPEGSGLKDKSKTFYIAVIGKNPFEPPLEEIYIKNGIKGNPVKILYLSRLEEISTCGCHLLFVAGTNKKTLNDIISVTKGKPILTVSDNKSYADKGIHINFLVVANKLKFEINQQSFRESGIVISYHLLRLATKVIK